MRPDPATMSDADLIAAVRDGDSQAYGVLYERHLQAAKRTASCLVRTAAEREDLVADAFLRVLRALRDGGGPTTEFRAYLLVTMRNAAISTSRGASVAPYADVPEALPPDAGDPIVNRWNAMTAASAFATLPERWRTVLWHTEVEEGTPAEVAPLLGMRPNGVAALAYRAREGLRQAYLRAHLPEVEANECRATVSKLAGWVRRSVPVPLGRKISRHLAVCSDCRARADTLSRVNEELRASLTPVLAKLGVALVIAATAVTVGASSPNLAVPAPVPAVVEPTMRTDSIQGPATDTGADQRVPDTGVPATVTSEPAAVTSVAPTPTGTAEVKPDKEAAKTEKKADKQAAKESRKAEKQAAKESKKAGK